MADADRNCCFRYLLRVGICQIIKIEWKFDDISNLSSWLVKLSFIHLIACKAILAFVIVCETWSAHWTLLSNKTPSTFIVFLDCIWIPFNVNIILGTSNLNSTIQFFTHSPSSQSYLTWIFGPYYNRTVLVGAIVQHPSLWSTWAAVASVS